MSNDDKNQPNRDIGATDGQTGDDQPDTAPQSSSADDAQPPALSKYNLTDPQDVEAGPPVRASQQDSGRAVILPPEESTAVSDILPTVPRRSRLKALTRGILRFILLIVIPFAGLLYAGVWWGESMRYLSTENAYLKNNLVAISADVTGRVVALNVSENELVSEGQSLFQIDAKPYEIAYNEAVAEMKSVAHEIRAMQAQYSTDQQGVREAAARIDLMKRRLDRQLQLVERGVSTTAKLDEAQSDYDIARRQTIMARERAGMVLAELGGDVNAPIEEHPKYLVKKAAVERAQLDLERTNIAAPAPGVVSNITLRLGEYVTAGRPIFSLIEADRSWIEANFKETQLTHLKINQTATVVADAYPEEVYRGRVTSLSPATGSEFSLLPPQNASGNWVKVVQRLPVRVEFKYAEGQPRLRAGMTVTVTVDTERDRSLPVLANELIVAIGMEDTIPPDMQNALYAWLDQLPEQSAQWQDTATAWLVSFFQDTATAAGSIIDNAAAQD